jgi:putative peptide maturation dehydrogenase
MRVRRCGIVMIQPSERLEFDLALLSSPELPGLRAVTEWIAYVPHAQREVALSVAEAAVLGGLSPSRWRSTKDVASEHGDALVQDLLRKEILVEEGTEANARDERLRATNWRPASAVMHYASRWQADTTEEIQQRFIEHYQDTMLERLGPAPSAVRECASRDERVALPVPELGSPLDRLLDRRVTCRNFDTARNLGKDDFSAVLYRTYAARAVDDYAPGVQLLKKGVPSAGGLHPTEAYLLVRDVEGVSPGLYHYHPVEHALETLRPMSQEDVPNLARRFVGAQPYLLGAHVFVIPVSRFYRNFWKYGNHAKAYRALILDIGHLSQTMYLAATELGLGAFFTAAVNEVDIEEAFGLDPLEEGPLAVTGFGIRAGERSEVEFDPLHAVWKD